MVNWINGQTNLFKCLVNHDGTFDTRAKYFSTDELWFQEWQFGGPPWNATAAALYQKWSPVNFVENWNTPMLIIHGEKDYRVPFEEGLSTFTALQRKGVKSRLLAFPDEGYVFFYSMCYSFACTSSSCLTPNLLSAIGF
jgi:dipeptidyl aminopeptidase/acylaminoacyl peptidase